MRIDSKWGSIDIDPERIYEVNVRLSPWENLFTLEFVMEDGSRMYAHQKDLMVLRNTFRRVVTEIQFISNYKKRLSNGRLFIDQPLRMAKIKERKEGKYDEDDNL